MNVRDILQEFDFFNAAGQARQKEFEESGSLVTLSAGDFYFHEGDPCSHVALIGRGDIRVYKTGESGREVTLYHVRSGETCFLTASCILAEMDYPATAVAESETKAILFPSSLFLKWVTNHEDIRSFVFRTLAARMSDVMSLVEEIAFNKMDRRLAEYLLYRFENNGTTVETIECTHEQIAGELGSAREVVTRLLQEFKRIGAIDIGRKKIVVKNIKTLRELCRPT